MIGAMPWIGFAWDAGACFVGFEAVTVVSGSLEARCAAHSSLGAAN